MLRSYFMSWRVIFTGVVCIALAVAISALALSFRARYPCLTGAAVVLDAGVILGGVKTILDITKTASDLRKADKELEKLNLEIAEKKRQANKDDARITVATLEDIERFVHPIPRLQAAAGRSNHPFNRAVVITLVCALGVVVFGALELRRKRELAATPPQEQQIPRQFPTNAGPSVGANAGAYAGVVVTPTKRQLRRATDFLPRYREAKTHKALVISDLGYLALSEQQTDKSLAVLKATEKCRAHIFKRDACRLFFVDDQHFIDLPDAPLKK